MVTRQSLQEVGLSSDQAQELMRSLPDISEQATTAIGSLMTEYTDADADYQTKLASFQQAQNDCNVAQTRRQNAARALGAYGVTVDQ